MFDSGQNWELFGYDMRDLGRHFAAAWRDLLWAYDSPVRRRLDEAVSLRNNSSEQVFHAGKLSPVAAQHCTAVLLPAELALTKVLRLPLAVESDLDAVLALEVSANSPFSADDTGYGWQVSARDEHNLHVVLVIVSLSSVMTYVGREYGSHDAHAQEVWAETDSAMVVIHGFGESRRDGLYQKRLVRVGGMIAAAALVLLLIAGTAAGLKRLELQQLEELAGTTQREAAAASRMRSAMSSGNDLVSAVNTIALEYPSSHMELARLSNLLVDDVYLERLTVSGREMDIRGRAGDASAVMKLLVDQEAYTGITAASPIRKIPGTGLEQFHLKIQIGTGVEQ